MIITLPDRNNIKRSAFGVCKTIIYTRTILLGNENDLCTDMCNNIIKRAVVHFVGEFIFTYFTLSVSNKTSNKVYR